MYRPREVQKSLDTRNTVLKSSQPNRRGHLGLRRHMNAHAKFVSWCKLYSTYLKDDTELYGKYLSYILYPRGTSNEVVRMRPTNPRSTYDYIC